MLVIAAIVAVSPIAIIELRADNPAPQEPNYELASRWTTTKIGKLIFDTTVTPH